MKIAVVVEVGVAMDEDVVVVEDSTETRPIMKMVAGMGSPIDTSQLRMVKRKLRSVVMVHPMALFVVLVVVASAMGKQRKGNDLEDYMNAEVELDVG